MSRARERMKWLQSKGKKKVVGISGNRARPHFTWVIWAVTHVTTEPNDWTLNDRVQNNFANLFHPTQPLDVSFRLNFIIIKAFLFSSCGERICTSIPAVVRYQQWQESALAISAWSGPIYIFHFMHTTCRPSDIDQLSGPSFFRYHGTECVSTLRENLSKHPYSGQWYLYPLHLRLLLMNPSGHWGH